jgi:Haem-degrading
MRNTRSILLLKIWPSRAAKALRETTLTGWAMALTVLGWALMWAAALDLVPLVPVSAAVVMFVAGLALIPFATRRVNRRAKRPLADVSSPQKEANVMRGSSLAASAAFLLVFAAALPQEARAANCPATHDQLTQALRASVKPSGGPGNGGLDNNEWAALVARDGTVCAVAFSGASPDAQWPGSRGVAAEKAFTANGFSVKTFALSTANLYAPSQPAGPLFGAGNSNPVVPQVLYDGDPMQFGSQNDPLVGKHLGGVIPFGGGLALYSDNDIVGGLGVSGDTSCADHNIAWRVRHALGLDHVPAGVSPDHNDGIIYDMLPDKTSASGYGHATCKGSEAQVAEQIHAGFVPNWARPTQ